nr:hypothetical protein [uncultured Noviherbaspirillum sp.]
MTPFVDHENGRFIHEWCNSPALFTPYGFDLISSPARLDGKKTPKSLLFLRCNFSEIANNWFRNDSAAPPGAGSDTGAALATTHIQAGNAQVQVLAGGLA